MNAITGASGVGRQTRKRVAAGIVPSRFSRAKVWYEAMAASV